MTSAAQGTMTRIRQLLLDARRPFLENLRQVAKEIGESLGIDLVAIDTPGGSAEWHGSASSAVDGVDRELPRFDLKGERISFNGASLRSPLIMNDVTRVRLPSDLSLHLAVRRIRSLVVIGSEYGGSAGSVVQCATIQGFRRWSTEEVSLLEQLADYLEVAMQFPVPGPQPGAEEIGIVTDSKPNADILKRYERLARYGNIVILETTDEFVITDVVGNVEPILGLTPREMLNNRRIWETLIDTRDRSLLRRKMSRARVERSELQAEVRIIHQRTREMRWMMLRALPRSDESGVFKGWEGFGIDITDRRAAQEELLAQNERLEALFEVTRAIQGEGDPAFLMLRGLRAIIRATRSHCGYGVLRNVNTGKLEVGATVGLSREYVDGLGVVLEGPSLLHYSLKEKRGILIEDLQEDPRAYVQLAKLEGLRSTIVMPLVADNEVLGGLVLFKRQPKQYSKIDFELVAAAGVHISGTMRQAESLESEKRNSQSLTALYRISHELAKHRTPREIAEHAFPILRSEFGLKRMWFGVLNEQGTHIVGKAGFGPGMRRQLQELQVELNLRHDFLDEAIRSQKPTIVPAGKEMECSGLNKVLQRLQPDTLLIFPLVSLNHVVGVLVVEPETPATFLRENRLQLLGSMVNEMATVIMARRFENKMAEALKMRMAGLLASGVAHNFNNILQAVLGQLSLIEMHLPKGSPAFEYSGAIQDAAKRGANLVSQLLSFSSPEGGTRQPLRLNEILEGSKELYRSLLGRSSELVMEFEKEIPEVSGDLSQIQQIVTNLLANTKDALADKVGGKVTVSTGKVRLKSGEIDPELAPGLYIRIDVSDNGKGMNAEEQARCFEPFFTTKNVDQSTGVGLGGSGLGLASAYSLARQHDGVITVHSTPGEGSVFSVYLPILAVHGVSGDRKIENVVSTSGAIILGMEGSVASFVISLFSSLGLGARTVQDGHQALDLIRREKSAWECVVIDADRMGAETKEFVQALREEHESVSVVIASSTPREWIDIAPNDQKVIVLEKPLSVWSLDTALQKTADRITGSGDRKAVGVNGNGVSHHVEAKIGDSEKETPK